jgi:hypothetical protein
MEKKAEGFVALKIILVAAVILIAFGYFMEHGTTKTQSLLCLKEKTIQTSEKKPEKISLKKLNMATTKQKLISLN